MVTAKDAITPEQTAAQAADRGDLVGLCDELQKAPSCIGLLASFIIGSHRFSFGLRLAVTTKVRTYAFVCLPAPGPWRPRA
jgi:hypothetical protein